MSNAITVKRIITLADGAENIVIEAGKRDLKITAWAVYKWGANGIPEKYWSMLGALTGVTPQEIYDANFELRAEEAA